jgi:hypothetical protein
MNVFAIYSRRDRAIAVDVFDTMRDHGYSVWFDFPISASDSYEETISRYMKAAHLLVAIWTPETMDGCRRDWEIARHLRKRMIVLSIGGAYPDNIPEFCDVVSCDSYNDVAGALGAFLDSHVMSVIFISYAAEDLESAKEVHALVSTSRYRVWLDRSSLIPGVDFPREISAAIDECTYLFLLWSAFASKSPWVKQEWKYARKKAKEIIPILLDDMPLPRPIRHVSGFRGTAADGIRDFLGIAAGK